jgi:hypothetical protein
MIAVAGHPERLSDPVISSRIVHWILRASICACFVGHGAFGIRQKADWLVFYRPFGFPDTTALATMPLLGLVDITLGLLALVRPTRVLLMYTAFWAILTALLRPFAGMNFFEALERAGNYGPSIALLLGTGGAALLSMPQVYDLADSSHFRRLKNVLAVTTFLLLLGHGALAVGGKPMLIEHWAGIGIVGIDEGGRSFTRTVGALEVAAAFLVLLKPTRGLCLAILAWKVLTEMLFLAVGAPAWEVLERGGSYGAPLALFVVLAYGATRTHPVAPPFDGIRLRTSAAKGFKKVENATALIWKLLLAVEQHFRKLNAPHPY